MSVAEKPTTQNMDEHMKTKNEYGGLDVHKDTTVIAVAEGGRAAAVTLALPALRRVCVCAHGPACPRAARLHPMKRRPHRSVLCRRTRAGRSVVPVTGKPLPDRRSHAAEKRARGALPGAAPPPVHTGRRAVHVAAKPNPRKRILPAAVTRDRLVQPASRCALRRG